MAKRGRLAFEAFSFSASDLPQMKLGAKTAATKEKVATLSSKAAKRPRSCDKLSDKRDGVRLSNVEKAVFVAPKPAKYRERYSNVCKSCFDASLPCDHGPPEVPLRLLLIGHNPSEHAWKSGFLYSNPTNRMMRLLTGASIGRDALPFTGLLPQGTPIEAQNEMPARFGIGLTDLGLEPGNNAADYGKKRMLEWAEGLYMRLAAHQRRAGGSPNLVAFTGKRQFRMIFPSEVGKIDHGEWTGSMPPGWPFPSTTRVWVLPSSSGRAVMSHAERTEPYRALAAAYHALPGTVIPKSEPSEESLREDAS